MTTTCTTCPRPVDGVAYGCPVCAADTARRLAEIVRYADDAQDAADGLARYGDTHGGDLDGVRPPGDAGAASVVARATALAVAVARDLAETRGFTLPALEAAQGPACAVDCRHAQCHLIRSRRREHPAALAARLLAAPTHLHWLRHRQSWPETAADIHRAARDLSRAADRPPDLVLVGVCDCGAWLYARQADAYACCRGCGSRWDVERSRDALRDALADTLLTAAEIATLAARAGHDRQRVRRTLNVWANRGLIVARGRRAEGPTYRVGDVMTRLDTALRRVEVEA